MSIVNATELAEILGREPRTITRWQDDGLPVKRRGKRGESNNYDTAAVIEWLFARDAGKTLKSSTKARRERIDLAAAELRLHREAGKVVSVDVVTTILGRWVEAALNVMEGIEEKYALRFPQAAGDDAALRDTLRALVREIREALSDIDLAGAFAGTGGSDSPVQLTGDG